MTEKKSEHDLPDDLNKMFSNFIKLKESYIKEQSLRQSMERTIKDLKEENKVVHEAEKSERNKLVVTRQLITQHQDNFSNLLFVKSENLKLSSQIKELEELLEETNKKLADEKQKWEIDQEKTKANFSLEMKKLELNNEKRAWDLQREAEMTSTQYKIQISELSKHLEQKENELTVVVFKYEQKLQEMKEKVNSLEADILKIQDRASRDVLLHKKKAMELEQEYKLLKQKQESTLLPQVRNTFEFAKVSQSSFRTPRTLPERPALQSILKKSSAYGSVMRKSLVSAPDDFSATATSTTDKMKETSEEIHSTSSSMPAEMSNKEALNTTFTMVENSHEEGSEPSREVIQSQTKKSKFTAARKRKLFRSNDLDMN